MAQFSLFNVWMNGWVGGWVGGGWVDGWWMADWVGGWKCNIYLRHSSVAKVTNVISEMWKICDLSGHPLVGYQIIVDRQTIAY